MKYLIIAIMLLFITPCIAQRHHPHNNNDDHYHGHHDDDDDDDEDDDDGCLPITLIEFKATSIHNAVKLVWSTASETNNDYFTLFRSPNGFEYWELVGSIDGAGNSNNIINYSYIDDTPIIGINYYVLMQTDYDGKRQQFDPIAIQYIEPPEYNIWEHYNLLGQEIK